MIRYLRRWIALAALLSISGAAVAQQNTPYLGIQAIFWQASADSSSSYVFKPVTGTGVAAAGNALHLSGLTVKTGAAAGFAMLLDATVLPANGAVTPIWCVPIGANSFISAQWVTPLQAANGITAGFSTTGCDTLTASATAKFMGQAY